MIGRTNVGGGGSGAGNTIGYIGVVYPAGSIVTCTKGTKTLRAKDTSGLYVFFIQEVGVWTVTSTDGVNTFTQDVEITTMWQDVVVNVSYWDGTMFDNGNQYEQFTGGWELTEQVQYPSYSQSGTIYLTDTLLGIGVSRTHVAGLTTSNKMDLSSVRSVSVTLDTSLTTSDHAYLVLATELNTPINSTGGYTLLSSPLNSKSTIEINIGSISDPCYVVLGLASAGTKTIYFSNVKLNFAT